MPKRQKDGDGEPGLQEEGSPFVLEALPTERFHQNISEYLDAWDAAEAAIKEAELFRKEVVFASIKELRYAGRRFADALKLIIKQGPLSKSEEEDISHLLREAAENCIRARNDAVDALVSYLHRYFHAVKSDYGPILMNSYFPEFMQLFIRLNEIGQVIPASRSSEREQRNAIYDRIVDNDIPKLRELYAKIESSKDLVDEDASRARKAQMRRERINWWIGAGGILVGVAGILVGILW